MPSFNRVLLLGNMTRDVQTRVLPSQSLVADFGLAMSRKYKNGAGEECEDVCFVDCTVFGRQAEVIQKYGHKGKPLFIEGRLRWDSWDDKNGGGKRSKLSVIVENFQLLGNKPPGDGADGEQAPADIAAGARAKRDNKPPPEPPFGDVLEFKEADIPF